jgi:spoIIIJ-associated protein
VLVRPLTAAPPDEDEDEDEAPARVPERPARGRRAAVPAAVATRSDDGAASAGTTAEAGGVTVGDEETVETAIEILEHMLELMQIDADVTSRPPTSPGDGVGMVTAVLDVDGDDLGMLIGRRGETLVSLQYILNLMLARRLGQRVMVGVDVGGYRRRREESLRGLANRIADRVRSTGQSITLEPMPPNERRIIHIALSDDPDVMTVSIGEGEGRKVAITPRR